MEDIALTPRGADENLPRVGIEGGKDIAGNDGDGFIHFFDGAGVVFIVDIVGEQHASWMKTNDEGRAIAQTDEGRVAAFGFGAELTPKVVIHVVAFDLVAIRHTPANFLIAHDMWESNVPARVMGDEIGDLATGSPGCGCGGLNDQKAILRTETDAESKEGDGDGGGLGGATKGFDHKSLALNTSRVELAHPGEGVDGDIAAEDHVTESGESNRIIGKRGCSPSGLGDCFVGTEVPPRNCGNRRFP